MKFNASKFAVVSLMILLVPTIAFAALGNPLGTIQISEVINRLIKFLLGAAGSVALLMFVWGGFQYLWSAGDDAKVKKGKATLTNAALGLAIIFLAYTGVNAVIKALTSGTV